MSLLLSLLFTSAALAQDEPAADEPVEAAEPACPEPTMLVLRATSDVENYYLSEAAAELAEAVVGLGCDKPADAELLGRLWQADGVLASLQGDPERAALSLSASARVWPDHWNVNFGTEAQKLYVHTPTEARGTLVLKGHRGKDVLVDGQAMKVPAQLEPGLHLVQVGTFPDDPEFAAEVTISEGAESVVLAKVAEVAAPGMPLPPPSDGSSRPLAIAAGGAGAIAVTSFVLAFGANNAFLAEPDRAAAEGHLKRNHTMNVAGLGLSAAGAGLLTVAVLKGQW